MIFIFVIGHCINVVKGLVSNFAIIADGREAVLGLLLSSDMDCRSNIWFL